MLQYRMGEFDRIAEIERLDVFAIGNSSAERSCSFSGIGSIDTTTGVGSVASSFAVYDVILRGNLGSVFFDQKDPLLLEQGGPIFREPPNYRLELRPQDREEPGLVFPDGFSVAFNGCPSEFPGEAPCERFGPFFLLFDPDGDGFADFVSSDGGAPHVLGAVPVPGSLTLAAGGLVALGWIGRRRSAVRG